MHDDNDDDDPPVSPDWFMRSNRNVVWLLRLSALALAAATALDRALS